MGPLKASIRVKRGDLASKPPITNIMCASVSPLIVPGIVDVMQILIAQQEIANTATSIINSTDNSSHEILSLATTLASYASALCFECKTAAEFMVYAPIVSNHFSIIGKAIAKNASRLVSVRMECIFII